MVVLVKNGSTAQNTFKHNFYRVKLLSETLFQFLLSLYFAMP